MINLDATTKSLQFKLGGSVASNQLGFSSSYVDATASETTPGEQDGASNNTTAVTVVSACLVNAKDGKKHKHPERRHRSGDRHRHL